MTNRNLVPAKTLIFKNKLDKILARLQNERTTLSLQTKEALTAEAAKLLSLFFQEIKGHQFKNPPAVKRTTPSLEDYNLIFQSLSDDIGILFSELENLESIVVDQFNTISTQGNRINSRIKKLASNVIDLKLYSKLPIKNNLFASDSFNDTSKIDNASKLLNSAECQVNNSEGIVTLPLDLAKTETVNLSLLPLVNSQSNGRNGNNQELNLVNRNTSLASITDGNSDTWFEYERVVKQDDGVSLILDLTFNLNKEEIVNFIRINPNNFGTKTEIEIIDITTSVDGKSYKSIKDEVQISGLTIFDEENVFKLSPSTSKFAGQGLFTFTPRFCKYVNIKLKQNSPYIINTVQGEQFRYAIGLRDIEIVKQAYAPTGELVSSEFSIGEEIKKIALKASQSIVGSSELGSIEYQVSFDNGSSWNNIAPLETNSLTNIANASTEVININTQDVGSINTESPVLGFRYKIKLKRESGNFNEQSVAFVEDIKLTSELKTVPLIEPWVFSLEQNPIPDSISILDSNFGSRGNLSRRFNIGLGTGSRVSFRIPWDDLFADVEKDEFNQVKFTRAYKVFVGGEEWTEIPRLSNATSSDKVYEVKRNRAFDNSESVSFLSEDDNKPRGGLQLQFGGPETSGMSPPVGSLIEIAFSEERLFFTDEDKTTKLMFPTAGDTSQISVYKKGLVLQETVELTPGSNIHTLSNRNILNSGYLVTFTNEDGHFTNEIPFENGQASPTGELLANGDYSIDKDAGIIYSFSTTDSTPGTVSYFYQETKELPIGSWTLENNAGMATVNISASGWETNDSSIITISSGVREIYLPDFSVLKNSVVIEGITSLADSVNPFAEEVEFIDGVKELSTVYKTEEVIPSLIPSPSVATFTLNLQPEADLYNLAFDDPSIFTTKVSSIPNVNSIGKYFVDTVTRIVYVHTGGATFTSPGKIKYFTRDLTRADKGFYSINYKHGIVYLQRSVPVAGLTLKYKYSNYFARYNIGRKVSPLNFVYNAANKTVQLKPAEIQTRNNLNNLASLNSNSPATYQVNYKYIGTVRKNIKDLEPFFTPIVKELIFQIIPSNLL